MNMNIQDKRFLITEAYLGIGRVIAFRLLEEGAQLAITAMSDTDGYQSVMVYLLSDASRYMNGAVIPMDGGRSLW